MKKLNYVIGYHVSQKMTYAIYDAIVECISQMAEDDDRSSAYVALDSLLTVTGGVAACGGISPNQRELLIKKCEHLCTILRVRN